MNFVEERKNLINRFLKFFAERGLVMAIEEPIIPARDTSLLFTNATIVPVKPYLRGEAEIPKRGLVIKQFCIRNQNLKNYADDAGSPIEYLSCFDQLGVLVPEAEGRATFAAALELLLRNEGIERSKLLIRAGTKTGFAAEWIPPGIRVELDSRPDAYYQWTYGIPGITGTGITFALRQPDGRDLDIGNFIELRSQGQCIGYEFGFGVETFLARKHGLASPIAASPISTPIFTPQPEDEKLRDCLYMAMNIIRAGVEPGSGRQSSVLRKALRIATAKGKQMGGLQHVEKWLEALPVCAEMRRAAVRTNLYLKMYSQRLEVAV